MKKKQKDNSDTNNNDQELKTLGQGILIWLVLMVSISLVWCAVFLLIDFLIFDLPPLFSLKTFLAMVLTTFIVGIFAYFIKRRFLS